mgnify:CR=1 FL=1
MLEFLKKIFKIIFFGILFLFLVIFNFKFSNKIYHFEVRDKFIDFQLLENLIDQNIERWLFQIFLVGLPDDLNSDDWEKLNHYKFAGFIFYKRNFKSPEELKNLIINLQKTNGQDTFFLIDEEIGGVSRLNLFSYLKKTPLIDNFSIDKFLENRIKNDLMFIKSLKINFISSPLIDWPYESQSKGRVTLFNSPQALFDFNKKILKWCQELKIFTALKHYPNLGFCSVDIHNEVCSLNFDLFNHEWHQEFLNSINQTAKFIMLSHIKVKNDHLPFSLSSEGKKRLLDEFKRKNVKFNGLFLTDDISAMRALKNIPPTERIILAIKAKNMILWSHDFRNLLDLRENIVQNIKKEKLRKDVYNFYKQVREFKEKNFSFFKEN